MIDARSWSMCCAASRVQVIPLPFIRAAATFLQAAFPAFQRRMDLAGRSRNISLFSSADMTSNGAGIWVGHYGQSGAIRMDISGGEITTTGDRSDGIRGFYHEGVDDIDLVVRDVTVDTAGEHAHGVFGWHQGTGAVNFTARNLAWSQSFGDGTHIVGVDIAPGKISGVGVRRIMRREPARPLEPRSAWS